MTRVLGPIREDMTNLRADVNAIAARLTVLESSHCHMRRMTAIVSVSIHSFYWVFTDETQTCNRGCGSGRDASLEVVLFWSGEDPTAAPVCIFFILLYVKLS